MNWTVGDVTPMAGAPFDDLLARIGVPDPAPNLARAAKRAGRRRARQPRPDQYEGTR